MTQQFKGARAFYGGKTPPAAEILDAAVSADPAPSVLYDHRDPEGGEAPETVRRIYDLADSLKRSPQDFRTWTDEDGQEAFFEVLLDVGPSDLRSRVQCLQRLGTFRFRKADGPDEKKAKISAVFADPDDDQDARALLRTQARRLANIWSPTESSLLHFIITAPAQVGRVLSDRLNPAHEAPLAVIGHRFEGVRSTELQPIAAAKVVAFERPGEIHLISAVESVLEQWDSDAKASGCEQFSLMDTLLVHELVEVLLDEGENPLPPLEAHMVAATFERYLKGQFLQVAVEDFFLNWPPLSEEELAERSKAELEQQMDEISAFIDDDDVPTMDDGDLGELPLDTEATAPRPKKKAKATARSKSGNKDGKKKVVKKKAPGGEQRRK